MQIKGLAHARTAPLRAASAPATARASLAPEAEVSRLAYEDLVLFLLQQAGVAVVGDWGRDSRVASAARHVGAGNPQPAAQLPPTSGV